MRLSLSKSLLSQLWIGSVRSVSPQPRPIAGSGMQRRLHANGASAQAIGKSSRSLDKGTTTRRALPYRATCDSGEVILSPTITRLLPLPIRLYSTSSSEQSSNSEQPYSRSPGPDPRNFIKKFLDNIQDEMKKNKELQESKKELEEHLRRLGDTDVMKKFEKIEKDTAASSLAISQKLNEFTAYLSKVTSDVKSSEFGQEAIRQAKVAAEVMGKTAKAVGDTQVYKSVSVTAKELDKLADVRMYSRPEELRMRSVHFGDPNAKVVEENPDAKDIELHKESKWYQGWKSFSESNTYYNKLLNWKMQFDDSENVVVRLARGVTDRVYHAFAGQNEVSEVLTEIAKVDPSFNKAEWLRFVEKEVVPNILEAFIRGDLAVLQDWCHERAYSVMAQLMKDYQKVGFSTDGSQIIDISRMEMASGKMIEQGPVLVITFQVFMIHVVRNQEGKVVEGDPKTPVRVHHVWVMCRDMEEYNPNMAWKLLELHMQKGDLSI